MLREVNVHVDLGDSDHYRSVPGKRPCTAFQGVNVHVAAPIQKACAIPGKRPCGPKLRVILKCPWMLTRDTTVLVSVPDHAIVFVFLPRVGTCAARGKAIGLSVVCQHENRQISTLKRMYGQ